MLINKTLVLCILLIYSPLKLTRTERSTNFGEATYADHIYATQTDSISDARIKYTSSYSNPRIRRQKHYPKWMPFPCANSTGPGIGRSTVRPVSVHQLRPGDIDVIGAMGDSLIAGNGALEEWALGTMIEHRGVSWAAGGQGTWREFLTVPNFLKEYNRNLTGYSTGTGEFLSPHSQMNVAYPVSSDADALHQARILVTKMKRDPRINFKEDWKMITIFFGSNDICSAECYGPAKATPIRHAKKLMRALDYLQDHLPRTIVNLVPVLDPTVTIRVKRTLMCHVMHRLFCACFHQFRAGDVTEHMISMTRDYQQATEQLISSGRYDKKLDFTVVIQSFVKSFNAATDPVHQNDEVIDISFITHDCFHFSQKGHALVANMLWNNLLQPVGHKSTQKMQHVMEKIVCPTPDTPFIFTTENSKKYLETGRQF